MPSIDDLRAVLLEREDLVADSTTDDLLVRRHSSGRPGLLAAAAVLVVIALTAVALARLVAAPRTQRPASPPSVPPSDNALTWALTVSGDDDLTAQRVQHIATSQTIQVTSHGPVAPGAMWNVSLFAPGAFRPPPPTTDIVRIDGSTSGYFTAHTRQLVWQNGAGNWTLIEPSRTVSTDDVNLHDDRYMEQLIALGTRSGGDDPVTAPFRPHLAQQLPPAAFEVVASGACVGYGAGAATTGDLGSVITVCRTTVGHRPDGPVDRTDRSYVRTLADGSLLTVAVAADHQREYSLAQLQSLAERTDVTPSLTDEATWLAVG